jgi:release factor glutamine methyltransferase
VREVLSWTTKDFADRQIGNPRLDAEVLVAAALGIDRIGLYLDMDRPLVDAERTAIRALVARRRSREPVAYILGYRDFYGRRFSVDASVLIPRPETEILVGRALLCIPEGERVRVLDVGTGSGAIALTLAAERPMADIVATDSSGAALALAEKNAARLDLAGRVRFEKADLVGSDAEYDLVVSNPPYVTSSELAALEPEVRDHEPALALEGGKDGLDVVRRLLAEAVRVTGAGAQLLFEVGARQAGSVRELVKEGAWGLRGTYRDLDGIERVVHLRRT